jgi:hypothetical protein
MDPSFVRSGAALMPSRWPRCVETSQEAPLVNLSTLSPFDPVPREGPNEASHSAAVGVHTVARSARSEWKRSPGLWPRK